MRQFTPPDYLVGPLRRLAEVSGETAYVGCWRQNRIAVLATVEGRNAVRVSGVHIGFAGAGHARASGKVLLAFAPDSVREAYLLENPVVAVTPRTIVEPTELRLELERTRLLGVVDGRVALVTGAGAGLGLGIAQELVAAGAGIGVLEVDAGSAKAAAEELCRAGVEARAYPADVANRQQVDDTFEAVVRDF